MDRARPNRRGYGVGTPVGQCPRCRLQAARRRLRRRAHRSLAPARRCPVRWSPPRLPRRRTTGRLAVRPASRCFVRPMTRSCAGRSGTVRRGPATTGGVRWWRPRRGRRGRLPGTCPSGRAHGYARRFRRAERGRRRAAGRASPVPAPRGAGAFGGRGPAGRDHRAVRQTGAVPGRPARRRAGPLHRALRGAFVPADGALLEAGELESGVIDKTVRGIWAEAEAGLSAKRG